MYTGKGLRNENKKSNHTHNIYSNKTKEVKSIIEDYLMKPFPKYHENQNLILHQEKQHNDRARTICRLAFSIEREQMTRSHQKSQAAFEQRIRKYFETERQKKTEELDSSMLTYRVQQKKFDEMKRVKNGLEKEFKELSSHFLSLKNNYDQLEKNYQLDIQKFRAREVSSRFRIMMLQQKLQSVETKSSKRTIKNKLQRKEIKSLKKKVKNNNQLVKRLREKLEEKGKPKRECLTTNKTF